MHQNSDISAWIAREIIPHEVAIRKWLARRWSHVIDVDDVIQEAYCRIANLASVDHIDNPGGYFHQTASAVVTDQMRRSEEHTSELQSLMRISYAVFCLKKKKKQKTRIMLKA